MLINWLLFVCIWYLSIVYLTGVSLLFSVFSFSSGGKMTPNDDEVFPQIGAQTFLPSFQLNSETLKTFCTRNHQVRGASSSASVHTLFFAIFAIALCLSLFKTWSKKRCTKPTSTFLLWNNDDDGENLFDLLLDAREKWMSYFELIWRLGSVWKAW